MGTVTLNIEIVGLCLLAVEEHQVHLLLPSTSSPCFHHDLPHNAALGYSTADDPGPADFTEISIRNAALDLSGVGGSEFQKPELPEIADISRITQRRIDPALLSDDSPGCVRSRIRIASGRAIPVPAEGEWLIPGHGSPVALAHRLRWEIEGVRREDLRLTLTGLHGNAGPAILPDLSSTSPTVHLRVRHAPYNEAHRDPMPAEMAGHFGSYYGLFPGTVDRLLPTFFRRRSGEAATHGKQKGRAAGDLLTCMLAQAPVG